MPPEIITGAPVGGAADLYSLGCVAYWLLTGRLVFEAATATAMILKHASEEPVPPSVHAEVEVAPELERIVLQCLAKKPDERFADANELAQALAAVEVSQPWTEERARRWWESHRPEMSATSSTGQPAG
jgi:serine/threonine-protein kinase